MKSATLKKSSFGSVNTLIVALFTCQRRWLHFFQVNVDGWNFSAVNVYLCQQMFFSKNAPCRCWPATQITAKYYFFIFIYGTAHCQAVPSWQPPGYGYSGRLVVMARSWKNRKAINLEWKNLSRTYCWVKFWWWNLEIKIWEAWNILW